MKKLLAIVLAVALLASVSGVALAGNNNNGNYAPSGEHFNLNIIGVKNPKTEMGDKVGGHVIFVDLYSGPSAKRVGVSETCIQLTSGPDFYVLDGNGTDDGLAQFQLPADVTTTYTVWVRALGKPTGEADMQLCAWDPVAEGWVCNVNVVELKGHKVNNNPKQKFVNVTSDLLYIDGVPLFSTLYEDYFWSYRNNGQKLAQLRFYPVVD